MPKKKSKIKKNTPKKYKVKKKIKSIKKKVEEKELVFKTKPEWVKSALINKKKYQKNIPTQLKIIIAFGKVKEKE